MVFGVFTEICKLCEYTILEPFHHPKKETHTRVGHSPFLLNTPNLGNHSSTLSLFFFFFYVYFLCSYVIMNTFLITNVLPITLKH